jgi:hypothetical protein
MDDVGRRSIREFSSDSPRFGLETKTLALTRTFEFATILTLRIFNLPGGNIGMHSKSSRTNEPFVSLCRCRALKEMSAMKGPCQFPASRFIDKSESEMTLVQDLPQHRQTLSHLQYHTKHASLPSRYAPTLLRKLVWQYIPENPLLNTSLLDLHTPTTIPQRHDETIVDMDGRPPLTGCC